MGATRTNEERTIIATEPLAGSGGEACRGVANEYAL